MSNTPRIDACIEEYRPGTFDFAWTLIGLARQIEYECKANAEICQTNYDRAEKAERELAQAQVRIEELDGIIRVRNDALAKAIEAQAEAHARCAELEKDAARYRWLRENDFEFVQLADTTQEFEQVKDWQEHMDAAIDAALRQEPHQEPDDSSSKG